MLGGETRACSGVAGLCVQGAQGTHGERGGMGRLLAAL